MECPYLKDIRFAKIFQIQSQQTDANYQFHDTDQVDEKNDIQAKMSLQYSVCKKAIKTNFLQDQMSSPPPDLIKQRLSEIQIQEIKISDSIQQITVQEFASEDYSENSSQQGGTKRIESYIMPQKKQLKNQDQIIFGFFLGQIRIESEVYIIRIQNSKIFITIQVTNKIKYFIDLRRYQLQKIELMKNIVIIKLKSGKQIAIQTQNALRLFQAIDHWIKKIPQKHLFDTDSLQINIYTIRFQQLYVQCDSLDLLLFKNYNFMSRVQRFLTNSQFDHVAMILKSSTQQLYIFQCTSTYGVGIYPLKSFQRLPCKKYYQKICYRKFSGVRTSGLIQKLQKFVKSSIGKKYKFDPLYLIQQSEKSEQQQPTFFCSDLVARALQQIGLFTKSIPSFKFLPKNFSSYDTSLNEINKFYLPEINIYLPPRTS